MLNQDIPKKYFINESDQFLQRTPQLKKSKREHGLEKEIALDHEEKLQTIVEKARDAVMMVDNEGRISYWNLAAEKMFGFRSQEAVGRELTIIIPERYYKDFSEGFRSFKDSGQGPAVGRTVESEAIRKNGTEFPVELSISAVQIKGQWYAVGIIRDISNRKRLEEALREELKKYQILFEKQKDAIMLVDLDTQRLLEVNEAATVLYRFSKEALLKMKFSDLIAESEKDEARTKKSIHELSMGTSVLKHKKKDGTLFTVEISACAFIWKNRNTFCAIIRDITERAVTREKIH
jgi:PAS domain S-box-containing protein